MARFAALAGLGTLVCLVATPVSAEWIDFDDLPASNDSSQVVGEEYAHLGAHFRGTDDGATWSGMSAGDPGDWGVDGSHGPSFLGFDGQSYAIAINFDAPVLNFQLDVARALGAPPFLIDQFSLSGFRDGRLVETRAIFLGGVGDWKTVALSSEVDRVVWFGTGLSGHRFAVDALQWEGPELEPALVTMDVDVRPGSDHNRIQCDSPGVVPVIVYGDEEFAVEDVDAASLGFGPGFAPPAHGNGPHVLDHDGDGHLDLLVHFRMRDAEIASDATESCVTGVLVDGTLFEGCDAVTPVGN